MADDLLASFSAALESVTKSPEEVEFITTADEKEPGDVLGDDEHLAFIESEYGDEAGDAATVRACVDEAIEAAALAAAPEADADADAAAPVLAAETAAEVLATASTLADTLREHGLQETAGSSTKIQIVRTSCS